MTSQSEQIKLTLDELNIDAISSVLKHLGIKWKVPKTGEERIPTKDDISSVAEYCMREAFKSKDKRFEIGGFEAEVSEGIIEIKFVIARANPLSKLLE